LMARYAYLRGQYPPTDEWPNKRCYFVARTGRLGLADYKTMASKTDEVGASRAAKHPAVARYLEERTAEQTEALAYGAADVLDDLWLGTEMALGRMPMQRTVVHTHPSTGVTTVTQVEVMDTDVAKAHKFLETWAKHYGLVVERAEVGGPGDFSEMTDEELLTELEAAGLSPTALPSPPESPGNA
ncbi:MAG: hypothetical protein WBG92_15170, partial [Thiohalocapsa sp.]